MEIYNTVGRRIQPYRIVGDVVGGVTGGLAQPTWNPSEIGPNIVLSDSNRTADKTGSGWNTLHAGPGFKTSGKWYLEIKFTAGNNYFAGVMNGSAPLSDYIGSDTNGYGYIYNGTIFYAANPGVTYPVIAVGDIVQLAFDASTGKMWYGKNGTFNGNPIAGTGQVGAVATGPGMYAGASLPSPGNTVTIPAITTYDPPTGFSVLG